MKILIISGFLGAGKTTFIKKMAEMTGLNIMVLENDYSDVGIDKQILQHEKQVEVWEMLEGCICCSAKADFAASVLTISNTLNPDYLIVEPTGIGRLSTIVQNIRTVEYERITLLKPITLIDVNCYDTDFQKYSDIYKDQVVNADRILFTKTENVPHYEKERIKSELLAMGVKGEVDVEHYAYNDEGWWLELLRDPRDNSLPITDGDEAETKFESVSYKDVTLDSIGELVMVMQQTIGGAYGDVRRAKGCVSVNGEDVRFDVVDKRYSIFGEVQADAHNVVFIGNDLDRFEIAAAFGKLGLAM